MTKGMSFRDFFKYADMHGCLTGDCPHANASACVRDLGKHVAELRNAGLLLCAGEEVSIAALAARVLLDEIGGIGDYNGVMVHDLRDCLGDFITSIEGE